MTPSNMTPEELERWHYANGDTTGAALYGRVVDGDEELHEEIANAEDAAKRAERDAEHAHDEALQADERADVALARLDEIKGMLREALEI